MKTNIFITIIIISGYLFAFQNGLSGKEYQSSDKNIGVILGTKVNVRESSSLKSKTVTSVKEGEFVKILEITQKREKIGTYDDYWIKIQTSHNKTGYLYGAFVFELNYFFDKSWQEDSCSAVSRSITFERNYNYKYTVACGDCFDDKGNQLNNTSTITGKYSINGSKISFSLDKQHEELYLYRFNRQHRLTNKKRRTNDPEIVAVEKQMGGCWGWKPASK